MRNESKREKFVRLVENRMNSCLKQLDLLSNLSNKSTYEYYESDIKKMLKALRLAVNELEKSFAFSSHSRKFRI